MLSEDTKVFQTTVRSACLGMDVWLFLRIYPHSLWLASTVSIGVIVLLLLDIRQKDGAS